MIKYVVIYTWEETCYVKADTPKEAENIADSIEMVALDLELREGKTRVRKATRNERLAMDFVGVEEQEEEPDLCFSCGKGVSDCATFGCGVAL